MSTNPAPHLFWITSRAAGVTALVLASLAVCAGLLMSTRLLKGRVAELRVVHEVLSLSAIVAIVVHATALLGDRYLHPSVADIAIPFLGHYRSFWTSLGIISGWSLIVLGLSYYARRHIGVVRWRKLHRLTALVWLLGLIHSLGEGTDAGQLWFLAMVALVAIPALGLLAARLLRAAGPVRPGRPRPAAPRLPGGVRTSPRPASARAPRPDSSRPPRAPASSWARP
jgi:sulfoxide reductase heme-binding subunit YedZ